MANGFSLGLHILIIFDFLLCLTLKEGFSQVTEDDCSNCVTEMPCFCVLDRDYTSTRLACFTHYPEDVRFEVEENGDSIYLTSGVLLRSPDYSTTLVNSSLILLGISNLQNHNGTFYRCHDFVDEYESHQFQLLLFTGPESEVVTVTPSPTQHPPATPGIGGEQAGNGSVVPHSNSTVIDTVPAAVGAAVSAVVLLCVGSVCVAVLLSLAVRWIRIRKKLGIQQPSDTPANLAGSDYINVDDDVVMGRSQDIPCTIFMTTRDAGNTLELKPLSYPVFVNTLPTEGGLQTDADTLLHEDVQLTDSPAYVSFDNHPKNLQYTQQDKDSLTEILQNCTDPMEIETSISYHEHSHPAEIMQTRTLTRDTGYTMKSFSYRERGHEDIPMIESPAYAQSCDCQKYIKYPQQDLNSRAESPLGLTIVTSPVPTKVPEEIRNGIQLNESDHGKNMASIQEVESKNSSLIFRAPPPRIKRNVAELVS